MPPSDLARASARSGDFLCANQPLAASRDDGLVLRNVSITAAVRCAGPGNRPTVLLGCYHVRQQNTFTGRLTGSMIDAALAQAKAIAASKPAR